MKTQTCKARTRVVSRHNRNLTAAIDETRRSRIRGVAKVRRRPAREGIDQQNANCLPSGHDAHGERAQALLNEPITYIYHKSFDKPGMESVLLGSAPDAPAQRLLKAPSGLPAYLASLYEVPLLTAKQEAHYFRKFNYLKHRAEQLRKQLQASRAPRTGLERLAEYLRQADDVRNLLIRSNLRLVVAVIRKLSRTAVDFSEMISDGNISLMRAVENFDFSRGFKFSTYATWAIRNNFSRSTSTEYTHRTRFSTGAEQVFNATLDRRTDEYRQHLLHEQNREAIRQVLQRLSERERDILACRFGLQPGSEPLTLEQVGAQQGVTKERIRQLEKRAVKKLQVLAVEEKWELPELN